MNPLEALAKLLQRLGWLPRHHREDPRLKEYDNGTSARLARGISRRLPADDPKETTRIRRRNFMNRLY